MDAPIGIFDSGLGGLTVFREIARELPCENLIYVGDTARVPYGVKSAETVIRYSREICDFLRELKVKAIVVACNTASALALPVIAPQYSLPLLGVLEPGATAAVRATRSGSIGVIGTPATIKSGSYPQAIFRQMPKAEVLSRACPLFVPLVEEGWIDHAVTREVAEIYLGSWRGGSLDTLILGCTHYPLLKGVIQEILGEKIKLVDSARETAGALHRLLKEKSLLSPKAHPGTHRVFTTDAPEKLSELAERFLGHSLPDAELAALGAA
jgi:glutamate racemase